MGFGGGRRLRKRIKKPVCPQDQGQKKTRTKQRINQQQRHQGGDKRKDQNTVSFLYLFPNILHNQIANIISKTFQTKSEIFRTQKTSFNFKCIDSYHLVQAIDFSSCFIKKFQIFIQWLLCSCMINFANSSSLCFCFYQGT